MARSASNTEVLLACWRYHCGRGGFSATLLSFAGVVLVVHSTSEADLDEARRGAPASGGGNRAAVIVVLASAVMAAVAYTTIRKLTTDPRGHKVDPMVLVL